MFDITETIADGIKEEVVDKATDWFQGIINNFKSQFVTYLMTVVFIAVILLFVAILSRGKIIKFKWVPKILVNCILGYILLFLINTFGGLFTQGAWTFTPKAWYSWVIVGAFGIVGVVFLIISSYVWPDLLVTTVTTAV